jgi:multidrug efflux pump subunit AcrA (membrane-fusion protein)
MRLNSKHPPRIVISVITGTALLLFVAGCKSGEKETEVVVPVQAATAQKADISRTVTADAAIFPAAQSVITPKINAPVRTFYVTRGQKVRQGQLLAVLENKDLAAAALDNKGSFEQAQAVYKTNVGATLPEDTQKTELDVKTTKEALDAQQKLYDSREELFKQGALPRKDLDQARVALVQTRSQYEQAARHLASLNVLVKEQALRAAGGQLTSAQGKYFGAEAQLSYSEIRSPINGVVTDRPLYPGEMASTTAPLITIMDVSGIIAKAHIPQADAQLLHKGDAATIQVPGLDPVSGTVTVVSPALDPNSTTVEIWVQAKNPDQKLRPGTTARISITAETVHDALVVPVAALLNATGDTAQVMVINAEGKAENRDVKTGIQTPEQVQIVSGLKPGEQVVTKGAYGLPDKTKVKVEKPAPAGDAGKDKDKD